MKKNTFLFARKENRRIFTPVITTKANKMTTTKLRKGEYQVSLNGNTYTVARNIHEDGKSWYVHDKEGVFLFDQTTKAKALKVLSRI